MTPISLQQPIASQRTASQDFGQFEDRDLTRRIVVFLASHGLLSGASVRLKVSSGHIELRGTVASFRQRERIESFIRRVAGVHQVTNQLAVGTPLPDFASRTDIRGSRRGKTDNLSRYFQD
jgi:osmotically-inducible protein OsmY